MMNLRTKEGIIAQLPPPGMDQLDGVKKPSNLSRSDTDPIYHLGIIIAVLVLITWGTVFVLRLTRSEDVKQLDSKIAEYDKQLKTEPLMATEKTYLALQTVASHMKALRDQRFLFLSEWNDVKASVPKDVQFSSVAMSDDGVFRISGVAKSMSSVAQLSQALTTKSSVALVTPLSLEKQSDGKTFGFSLSFKVTTLKKSKKENQ